MEKISMKRKFILIDNQIKFQVVKHAYPDMELACDESQYAIISKSENNCYNSREILNFVVTSDGEAKEIAWQYAKEQGLL